MFKQDMTVVTSLRQFICYLHGLNEVQTTMKIKNILSKNTPEIQAKTAGNGHKWQRSYSGVVTRLIIVPEITTHFHYQ